MLNNINVAMKLNKELNGVELYFSDKPEETIRNILKENKFRWSKYKKCWYAKQNSNTLKLAEKLTSNSEIITTPKEIKTDNTNKKASKKNNISLWDLTRWEDIEVNNNLSTKEIAKEIRQHIKKRFPFCKFSVRSDYSSISFYIVESPFKKDSIYLEAIKEYCTNLIKSYQYCTNYDPYGDYGSSYNFYGAYANIAYDYKQTEQTEQIKEMIKEYDVKLAEFEKAEEVRKEREYQEREIQRQIENEQYQKRQEEENKQKEFIYNNVEIVTLDEKQQYLVISSEFANLNKNNTLDEYKKEVEKGDYSLQNVKITKEIHFKNTKALEYFSNMLLHDFDFLKGTGGSYTDDPRINSMTDYYNMSKEEQQTVIWNLYGVAIYFNNELQFVIDAQGCSYSRYVGLTDNARIYKKDNVRQLIN